MKSGYWQGYLRQAHVSRRRFTEGAAAAGLAAAAAGLVGCSSSNSNNNTAAKPSAAATTAATSAARSTTGAATPRAASPAAGASAAVSPTVAADNSANGKSGGTLKFMLTQYPSRLTVIDNANAYLQAGYVFSSLIAQSWGREGVSPLAFSALEPDLAQALPEQPDNTTFVFKLRPGVKFQNGRAVTSDDVKYSFDRWTNDDKSVQKSQWTPWYDHTETPDPQTVIVKAKAPFVDATLTMGANSSGFIFAKEWEESPDAANKMMGSGPFIWADAQTGTQITLKKNPDYYLKPFPYFDQIVLIGTTDPVARITNFISKQVQIPWHVYADDRDQIKKARPDAKIEPDPGRAPSVIMRTDKPPFNDPRIRQALSMAIDRKKIRDTANSGEGVDDQYFNVMYKDFLGTSEVKDLGDPAKYWQYNPQAAKQLFQAAGVTQPIETQMTHWAASIVGQWLLDMATLTQASWKDLGLVNAKDFTDPDFLNGPNLGKYDGTLFTISDGINGGAPAISQTIRNTWYWGPNGEHSVQNTGYVNDPQLSTLGDKQVSQLNKQERTQTLKQMEQIIAQQQYMILTSSTIQSWMWDPSLKNVAWSVEQGSFRFQMKWWFG